eukprot:TRINITY_DN19494_c0_g1_i1.p1 TRINITY_DN19494_c0_g1~~TRINITY_DN19494_c0_g1_i1.p1  ORF type:complete len:213 (-),score=59.75 TRINITY_DN19494_c0_g1_i1:366-1004(-)
MCIRDRDGYTAVQLGAIDKKLKRVTNAAKGHYERSGVAAKRHVVEFRVTPDAVVREGTELFAAHFVPGQKVDVVGKSKGKGFAGVMKRHGFGGGNATHGNSRAHRKPGSTGAGGQDPGRVIKGHKMAGHMGDKRTTVQNIEVYKVDVERNLIFLRGSIPGSKGSLLQISDAIKGADAPTELPFPTISLEQVRAITKSEIVRPAATTNPYVPE